MTDEQIKALVDNLTFALKQNEVKQKALEDILQRAKDHFCFDAERFQARDIQGLCDEGGEVCDWTMIAILADDALKD